MKYIKLTTTAAKNDPIFVFVSNIVSVQASGGGACIIKLSSGEQLEATATVDQVLKMIED